MAFLQGPKAIKNGRNGHRAKSTSTLYSIIPCKLPKNWFFFFRSNDFKEDDAIWKNGEDGGAGGGGPPPTGMSNMGPTGGYVAK